MAADQHRSKKVRRLISCFSLKGCFGISHEKQESNIAKNNEEKLVKYGTRRSSGRARARTVPMSHPTLTTSFVVGSSKEIHVVGAVEASDDQLVAPQPQQVISNKVQNKNLCKSSRVMGSIKFEKNSTTLETWSSRAKLLHSESLPPPQSKRGKSTADGNKAENGDQLIISDQLDPMVGALIMMVTLIVMLIWGKLCAIICTAAWFYIIPRFRTNNDILDVNKLKNSSKRIDVDSHEYKKKVVLEGFLERD